jgi:amidase
MTALRPTLPGTDQAVDRPFDLREVTIAELQEGMRSGAYTARLVVEKYLARIEALDRQGPTLRSVIEVNPEALARWGGVYSLVPPVLHPLRFA